ncbi:MAG: transposase-like protein [Cellvibrionaceae bacterium]|jgi:transposase-like protein
MTQHSVEQKEAIVNRFLQSGLSIREFAELEGITKSSLYSWSKKFNNSDRPLMEKNKYSGEQRFSILLETATLSEAELSEYCRTKGLYPDHLKQWKQAFIKGDYKPTKNTDASDKKRIKALEKELAIKEKALAETAALLVLRKKFNAHFNLDEE